MSTIASPREPFRRTPNSSTRPSLEISRSAVASPVLGQSSASSFSSSSGAGPGSQPAPVPKRANRAALREYYNLRASAPRIDLPDSEVPAGEIDAPNFDADDYVAKVVARSSLEELLRLYTRVVGEVRALDAEKKALVYDNYSKLITATETIRKMRTNMDPLNPMASTLDPAIAQIYSQASSIREALRASVPAPDSAQGKKRENNLRQQRTRELAAEVLATPERLRNLVKEGKVEQALKEWEMPRRLLLAWKEKGVGGKDVDECLEEGDEALRPEERRASGVTERSSTDTRVSRDEILSRDERVSRDGRLSKDGRTSKDGRVSKDGR
ncbi:Vps51/Vps67-domain-containing protein [Dactylonectria estremocensis]|uniref:Vacuolar protein sorting-associated protein 51 homolog n=1 Tax=Dactylonectria estremocensis TaxID=1079267 RepID=A0A9P9F628_9HYPO|nr:Vps51/Vps67-domain-containing protein [Dactylonectria estremocensis]